MKTYFFDFWYLLFMKIAKRVCENSSNNNQRISFLSFLLVIATFFVLIAAFPLLILLIFKLQMSLTSWFYFTISTLLVFSLFIYKRYIYKTKWKLLEQSIDKKYIQGKRDFIFFMLFSLFIASILYLWLLFAAIRGGVVHQLIYY